MGISKLLVIAGGAYLLFNEVNVTPEDAEPEWDPGNPDSGPQFPNLPNLPDLPNNEARDRAAKEKAAKEKAAKEKAAKEKAAKEKAAKEKAAKDKAGAASAEEKAAAEKAAKARAAKAAEAKAAREAEARAAQAAEQKAGKAAAERAAKAAEAKAAKAAAEKAAKAAATKAAARAARIAKGSSLLEHLTGGPAQIISMILAQVLIQVLDLQPDQFVDCETGEYDMNSIPTWAQVIIGGVPFLGDVFDLIGNKLCLKGGCPNNTEDSNGLCYKACDSGFKSDGAIMCYKQYPEFENNGMGHTITSITKKILVDTGRVPNECGDDEDKVGLLCYEKAPPDWINVAGTIWQTCPSGFTDTGIRCENNTNVGAGRVPELSDCPPGWTNDGLTCREPISLGSCPGGWHDDGLLCREPMHWDSCCSRFLGGCVGCVRGGEVRAKSSSGGRIQGRSQKGPADYEERIDGLNYNKCPDGFSRVPGMPYLCTKSFTKQSRVLGPRPMKCPKKKGSGVAVTPGQADREVDIGGLCYSDIPAGYSRKTLGLLDQDCPASSTDFGVGCTRQAYNRGVGVIPLIVRMKGRNPNEPQ